MLQLTQPQFNLVYAKACEDALYYGQGFIEIYLDESGCFQVKNVDPKEMYKLIFEQGEK